MAYSNDILALSPDHYWKFDGNVIDSAGALNTVNTGCILTRSAIALDAINCLSTDAVADITQADLIANINDENHRLFIAGWFQTTTVNQPPVRIIGQGGTGGNMSIFMGFGNNLIYELDDNAFTLQIYGDVPLEPNRPYHLALGFQSNTYDNKIVAYLDGVRQTITDNDVPGSLFNSGRGNLGWGGKASGLALGGVALKLVSPVIGDYNHWATWSGVNATLTDANVKDLFQKGALANITITSDTEANMQASINTLVNNNTFANNALDLDIQAVTGDGNLALTFTDVVFNELTSMHVRYLGTGTLTITNTGTSNTLQSKCSSNIVVVNPYSLTLTNLKPNTEVRVFAAGTTTEIIGQEDVTTGTFTGTITVPNVDIRIVSLNYKIFTFYNILIDKDTTISVEQFYDRTYKNP